MASVMTYVPLFFGTEIQEVYRAFKFLCDSKCMVIFLKFWVHFMQLQTASVAFILAGQENCNIHWVITIIFE